MNLRPVRCYGKYVCLFFVFLYESILKKPFILRNKCIPYVQQYAYIYMHAQTLTLTHTNAQIQSDTEPTSYKLLNEVYHSITLSRSSSPANDHLRGSDATTFAQRILRGLLPTTSSHVGVLPSISPSLSSHLTSASCKGNKKRRRNSRHLYGVILWLATPHLSVSLAFLALCCVR